MSAFDPNQTLDRRQDYHLRCLHPASLALEPTADRVKVARATSPHHFHPVQRLRRPTGHAFDLQAASVADEIGSRIDMLWTFTRHKRVRTIREHEKDWVALLLDVSLVKRTDGFDVSCRRYPPRDSSRGV
jgi:hypothetical protein